MSYHKPQFQNLIERTLKECLPALYSPEAVQLLLGTAAQESGFGRYLRQVGGGPALGAFQMEPETFKDLVSRFRAKFLDVNWLTFAQLEWDLRASIIMARIKYFSCPGPLPKDLDGQAAYWDRYYNCNPIYGTVQEYLENYRRYVG